MEVKVGKEKINELDDLLISYNKDKVDKFVIRRSNVASFTWKKLMMKENMFLQKSRLKLIREGDMNNKYFHNIMKGRTRRKYIRLIQTEGGVLESVGEVEDEVRRHFREKYTEPDFNMPSLDDIEFRRMTVGDRNILEEPFYDIKINNYEVMRDQRSLGPMVETLFL